MHRVYPDYVHPEAAIRDWDYEARTDCKEDVSVVYRLIYVCVVDLLVYQIMRRDDYTCFITHALDLSTPDERSQAHGAGRPIWNHAPSSSLLQQQLMTVETMGQRCVLQLLCVGSTSAIESD